MRADSARWGSKYKWSMGVANNGNGKLVSSAGRGSRRSILLTYTYCHMADSGAFAR